MGKDQKFSKMGYYEVLGAPPTLKKHGAFWTQANEY